MYIYNYIHIWRAVCNGKNPSANNYAADHSCWRASFLAFCLGGRPAIYNINIP